MKRLSLVVVAFGLAVSVCASANADTYTWFSGYSAEPWDDGAYWTGPGETTGVVPGPSDTTVFVLPSGTWIEVDMDVSATVAGLQLTGGGPPGSRLCIGAVGGNTLTVTSAIVVGAGQELYSYSGGPLDTTLLYAPITLTGGTLGDTDNPGSTTYSAFGLGVVGNVTATSGSSTLNSTYITGSLTVNNGATVAIGVAGNAPFLPGSTMATLGTTVSGTLNGVSTLGGPVYLSGGTLSGSVTYSGAVTSSGVDTIGGGTFNSTLTVSGAGNLSVNSTIAPTGVTVSGGGVLQGTGAINQAIALSGTLGGTLTVGGAVTSTGGTLSPGAGGNGAGHAFGTLTISGGNALTLDSLSTLIFNLGANSATSDQITIGGTVALGGATLDLFNMGTLNAGAYTLLTYANTASPGTLTLLAGQLSGFTYTETITSTSVTLNVLPAGATTYTWTGGAGSNWTASGNWDQGGNYPGHTPATDIASFNFATTPTPTVAVNAPTTIANLTFVAPSSGTGTLTLNGPNALTVTNAVTLAANEVLQGGGTLNAPVTLTGGTLSGVVTYGGAVTALSGASTINGGTFGSLGVSGGATLNVNGTIAPTGVSVGGGGILQGTGTIDQAISLSGTLGGTLTVGGDVTSTGGTLSPGSGGNGAGHAAGALAISGGNTLTLDSLSTLNFNLGSATANSDQIAVGGAVYLGGATVNLYSLGTIPATGGAYTLMTYGYTASPGTLTIPANQLPGYTYTDNITSTGVTLTLAQSAFAYTWAGGSGNTFYDWTVPGYWTGGPAGWVPGLSPLDTVTIPMYGGIGTWFQININTSTTIASLALSGTGRLAFENPGRNTLTVTNPIQVGANQELYCYLWENSVLNAPINLTGGILGYPGSSYGIALTGNVTASSGTSTLNFATITGTLTVAGGATLTVANASIASGGATVSGILNGSDTLGGAVTLASGTLAGSVTYTGAVTSNGADTISGGTFNSTLTVSGAGNLSVNGTIAPTAVAVNGGGVLQGTGTINAPVNLTGGTLSGTVTFNGDVTSNGTDTIGGGTFGAGLIVNTGAALSVNSTIAPASVTVSGGGILQGTGTINVPLALPPGATLAGSLTIGGALSSTGATLCPGSSGQSAGTLTVIGDVTLDHATTLDFNLGAPGTVGGGINDLITITGSLSLDGTLNVTGLTGFGPGTYTLFTYTGSLTEPSGGLTQGTMPAGYTCTIDTTTAHQVNLDVTEEVNYGGDTNRDGLLSSLDIDAIYQHFGAPATSQWKVDGDGNVVGQGDVTYELHTYFHTNYGDANLDTKTDFSDFQVLLDHWQVSGPTIGWWQGDFNGSYSVDFLDFQILLDYWNPGGWSFGQQAPAQTPEPASLTLLALGGLALLRRGRKA